MNFFETLKNIVDYILDIRWYELPKNALFLGLLIGMSYCAALILVGVPGSIWTAITKKKVREDIERKVITVLTVCFSVVALLLLFQ